MENLNKVGLPEKGAVNELDASQLAAVTGGAFWANDGYCGTVPRPFPFPIPVPPNPWSVVSATSFYVNPAPFQAGMGMAQLLGG